MKILECANKKYHIMKKKDQDLIWWEIDTECHNYVIKI